MENEDSPVIEIDDSGFDAIVAGQVRLVIDCWAPWCGDCRRMAPVFEELARDNSGKIAFAKINVELNPGVKERFEILAIPTLLIFREGKLVGRQVEPPPRKPVLQTQINESLV